ncbi:MAG: cobalamin-dependent protein [Methanomassiliicoccales archaeon]|jgi:methylmalonyl-CoA mutase cobalamin-binding domain/chain
MTLAEPSLDDLVSAMVRGDMETAVKETTRLKREGVTSERIVLEGIEVAMIKMDTKCTMEDFNLLEIMLVGRAAMAVLKEVVPAGNRSMFTKGSVVLATMEGDVHDLGKNIVKMVLTGKGYEVIDCGKDCPVARVTSTVALKDSGIIGVSGLITSIVPAVRALRPSLQMIGITNVKIIAGGAALHQASAQELNVDHVANNVFDGASYMESLRG